MSTKYKATTTDQAYFITITTVGWVDIFTRLNQKYNIVNDLQYCQEKKGLEIYAQCIMHSHIHLMCKATNGFILSDVMRDFKKYTSKKIIQTILEEPESRREWLLTYFEKACAHLKKDQEYKIVLTSTGYTFSESAYIGWCNSFDLSSYSPSYEVKNNIYSPLRLEIWSK